MSPSQYESSLDLWRGMLLEWSDDEQGLYVVDVMPGSISERAGLSSDDRIVGINGVTQTIARDLLNTLQSDSQPFSLLLVSRGDQLLSLPTGPE